MKNSFSFLAAVILLSSVFVSCKDKIDLVGEGKESAVVIGILDIYESTHYVKVTRTFIGDGITNTLDIAQIPDSSYFDNVEVKIQEVLGGGNLGRSFTLHDTIIQNKDADGVFFAPEQKVYVFYTDPAQPLLENATYQLTVSVDNGRIVVTGQTSLVSGITPGNWASTNSSLKLTGSGSELGIYATQIINVSNVGNSYKLNARVRFDYREFSTGLSDSTDHSISFNLGEADVTPGFNTSHSFAFIGETFYKTLKERIPVSTSVEKRVYTGFEFFITGGSRELANYIEVNKPSSSLAQNKPTYTNLNITEGHTVLGIFASRQTVAVYKPAVGAYPQIQGLDKKSRRELSVGPQTGPLGFCSRHVLDGAPTQETWFCN